MDHPSAPAWRKATRSGGNGACVEVADNLSDRIGVRDSKNPDGGELWVAPENFRVFVDGVTAGEFA